jgi:hypothetical protein
MHPSVGRENQPPSAPPRWAAVLGIVLAATAVYQGVLGDPLIYDDRLWITGNPSIHQLGSLVSVLFPPRDSVLYGRPFLSLSLALNYAVGGGTPWGYHLANLFIHILAALVLFGVVELTLAYRPALFPTERDRVMAAFAVGLLWAVHPLQTESVTYASQRAESLMGLLYLLTLYCFIRGAGAQQPRGWHLLSVLCCFLGMATKEVMVTAPLIVLAYDRTFVAGKFRAALRLRWRVYLGLACTWLVLGYLSTGLRGRGVGFGLGYSWGTYGLTECWVVAHYLLLAIWPHPLVFDYGAVVVNLREILPCACVLASLLGMVLIAFERRSALGFAGMWFFLILVPGSSIVPIAFQPMAEHRMYLPLAGVVAILVGGAWSWLGRRSLFLILAAALALGTAAAIRNRDYRNETLLWGDTVQRRPANPRAHLALGEALEGESRHAEAAEQFTEAIRLDPGDFRARMNLGLALYKMGRVDEALAQYWGIAPPTPDSAPLHFDMGLALEKAGRRDEAKDQYLEAVRIYPGYAEALAGLARLNAPATRP